MEANKLTCEQANKIDLVDFQNSLGHPSTSTRSNDWYLFPLREEKFPSFKVNKKLNVWYDLGLGDGGTLVDFTVKYFICGVSEALRKISFFHPQSGLQKSLLKQSAVQSKSCGLNKEKSIDSTIEIMEVKEKLCDVNLRFYVLKRKIARDIANKLRSEVIFQLNNRFIRQSVLNNLAGEYELRNEFFKGSSSPESVTYFNNKADTINVFEGFFDSLAYQTIHQNEEQAMTNFLVLNSLAFFEKNLHLMEKHECVNLFLDNDEAGKKYTSLALKTSERYHDESKLYAKYKDVNDYLMQLPITPNQRPSHHL